MNKVVAKTRPRTASAAKAGRNSQPSSKLSKKTKKARLISFLSKDRYFDCQVV